MAKKKKEINNEVVLDQMLEDVLGDRFGRYSKYIIQERALPDIRDGLKPVQRRIIYAMNKEGNTFDKPYRKSAKTVGLVIGNYHPHGDTSVYDAMVRMSQGWKINMPLIDMQGNNGSIDDDPAAAMRYTEARLDKFTHLLTEDLPFETVNWVMNFDDTEMIPEVFPSRIPLLLVNGSTGIAAGYATNIAPFNLNEIMDAVIYRLKYPNSKLEKLMDYIKGPDFPTGGILQGTNELTNALSTGKGKVVLRSKLTIAKENNKPIIVISEIPYEVVKSQLVVQIDNIRINKEIDNIVDVRDESDKDGLRIVIELKPSSDPQTVLNYLYKKTNLQVNYNFNMVAIKDNKPQQVGLIEMLDSFIDFRKDVVLRRSNYLLNKYQSRIEVLDGLIKASSIMNKIIKTIQGSKNRPDVINNLINTYKFTQLQAESIANMRLYRLSNTDILEVSKEQINLNKEVEVLKKIVNDPKELVKVIIKESQEVNKTFTTPRKTKLVEEIESIEVDESKLIDNEQVMVAISRDGYLKRSSLRSYTSSNKGDTGTKDGDIIVYSGELNMVDNIIIFSNKGTALKIPVYKIEEFKWKDIGSHLSKYCKTEGEQVIAVYLDNKPSQYFMSITKKGMIKKTGAKKFEFQKRFGKGLVYMKLKRQDEVVDVRPCTNKDEVLFITKNGYANMFSTKLIEDSAINTIGLVSSKVDINDEINQMYIVSPKDQDVTYFTPKKKVNVPIQKLTRTRRGNKGVRLYKVKEKE